MKVKYILLGISVVLCLSTFYFYKKYVLDYGENSVTVVFERETEVKQTEKELVDIFIPNENMTGLDSLEVEIPRVDSVNEKAAQIFEKLRENVKFIDEDLSLMSVYYTGGDLYLNFNGRFKSLVEDSDIELLLIYSLVNSMTEIPRVDMVKFLVEDKELDSGNKFLMNQFFKRDLNI